MLNEVVICILSKIWIHKHTVLYKIKVFFKINILEVIDVTIDILFTKHYSIVFLNKNGIIIQSSRLTFGKELWL